MNHQQQVQSDLDMQHFNTHIFDDALLYVHHCELNCEMKRAGV